MSCPGSRGLQERAQSPASSHAFPRSLLSLSLTHCVPFWSAPSHLKVKDQAGARKQQESPGALCPSHSWQHSLDSVRVGWGGPVPTLSPPGPGCILTVARMWVWASRSSCLSPSVSAVTAYLVAL